jgi:hypothetical protein
LEWILDVGGALLRCRLTSGAIKRYTTLPTKQRIVNRRRRPVFESIAISYRNLQ